MYLICATYIIWTGLGENGKIQNIGADFIIYLKYYFVLNMWTLYTSNDYLPIG